jgi:hypothetical protein
LPEYANGHVAPSREQRLRFYKLHVFSSLSP